MYKKTKQRIQELENKIWFLTKDIEDITYVIGMRKEPVYSPVIGKVGDRITSKVGDLEKYLGIEFQAGGVTVQSGRYEKVETKKTKQNGKK
jgi:hypothetical protein